jgi:serine/threonine protein kinase
MGLAAAVAERMSQCWMRGDHLPAEAFLDEHPELWNDPEHVLQLVYEEMCLRQELAEPVTLPELQRRFPQWSAQLALLFRCQRLLEPVAGGLRFPRPGETIGEFLLVAELGRGAHGRVFLAQQQSLGSREVVLKIGHGHNGEHLCLARLQHTHIVPLYSAVDDVSRGLHVLCMPYFAGISLARLLEAVRARPAAERSGRFLMSALDSLILERPNAAPRPRHAAARRFLETSSYAEAICWIVACLADALHYAHEQDVVHLDLKPSNILLTANGQPMLLDFHLARRPMRREEISSEGIGGTLAYMSPEQRAAWSAVRERREPPWAVDARSDIYSLGVVLWEGLSTVTPRQSSAFADPTPQEQQISQGLADIVGKCLQPDADQRYASMKELADDLRRHLANLPLLGVRNRSLRERWRKWRVRRPHSMALAVMMLSLFAALAAVGFGASTKIQERARLAESALRDGRLQMSQHEWEGAFRTLRRGLTIAETLSRHGALETELRDDVARVERERQAVELATVRRTLAELAGRIRSIGGASSSGVIKASSLEQPSWLFWERRWQIVMKLKGADRRVVDPIAAADLLELAIFLADMEDGRHVPQGGKHARSIEILHQALALLGPSPALDAELARRDDSLGVRTWRPETAWQCVAVGRAFLKEHRFLEAARYFEQAMHLDSQGLWPNFFHGQCCYRQGRYSEAALSFSVCIGASPDSWGCFHNRSMALAALAQFELALADCEHAAQLEPHAVEPRLQHALLRLRHWELVGAYTDALVAASLAIGNHCFVPFPEKKSQLAPASSSSLR